MSDQSTDLTSIVEAIHDLTRVMLAVSGKFSSKAEAARRLADLSVPPARIGTILNISTQHVTSVLAKAKNAAKRSTGVSNSHRESGGTDAEK